MKNTQQGIAPIIIALILALLAGGGYAVVKTNPGLAKKLGMEKQVEKKEAKKNETTNWKTYTNPQYGFEVKYPTDWTVNDHSALGGGIREKGETQFSFTSPDFSLTTGKAFSFSVMPTSFKNNQEFLLWRNNANEGNPNTKGKWVAKEINLSGIGQAVESLTVGKEVHIVKAPYLYSFPDFRANPPFSDMMSTFKFTK